MAEHEIKLYPPVETVWAVPSGPCFLASGTFQLVVGREPRRGWMVRDSLLTFYPDANGERLAMAPPTEVTALWVRKVCNTSLSQPLISTSMSP